MTKTPHDSVNRTEARVAGLPRRCASATIGVVNSMRSNGILSEAQALAELRHHAVMWENYVAALRDGAGRDALKAMLSVWFRHVEPVDKRFAIAVISILRKEIAERCSCQ